MAIRAKVAGLSLGGRQLLLFVIRIIQAILALVGIGLLVSYINYGAIVYDWLNYQNHWPTYAYSPIFTTFLFVILILTILHCIFYTLYLFRILTLSKLKKKSLILFCFECLMCLLWIIATIYLWVKTATSGKRYVDTGTKGAVDNGRCFGKWTKDEDPETGSVYLGRGNCVVMVPVACVALVEAVLYVATVALLYQTWRIEHLSKK